MKAGYGGVRMRSRPARVLVPLVGLLVAPGIASGVARIRDARLEERRPAPLVAALPHLRPRELRGRRDRSRERRHLVRGVPAQADRIALARPGRLGSSRFQLANSRFLSCLTYSEGSASLPTSLLMFSSNSAARVRRGCSSSEKRRHWAIFWTRASAPLGLGVALM
jgi:hypothetical protein